MASQSLDLARRARSSARSVHNRIAPVTRISYRAQRLPSPSSAAVADGATTTGTSGTGTAWDAFAEAASGEWEAVTATFTSTGIPMQLPENVVPGAYREWGVELHDWQSQCSAHSPEPGVLVYLLRRLMPTVGCEADAVAFKEESRRLFAAGGGWASGVPRPVLPDGAFVAGPAQTDAAACKMEVEASFPDPDNRTRVRVVLVLSRHWQSKAWQLSNVDMHQEKWDTPYVPIRSLAGCGGGMVGFAKSAPVAAEEVQGSWSVALCSGWVRGSTDTLEPLSAGAAAAAKPLAPPSDAVLLPQGVWVKFEGQASGEGFSAAMGKLAAGGAAEGGKAVAVMRACSCAYSADGTLREAFIQRLEKKK